MRGVLALAVAAGLVLVLPGLAPGLPVPAPGQPGAIVPLDVNAVAQAAHEGRLLLALPGLLLDARLEPNPIALGAVYGVGGEVHGVVDAVTTFKGATVEGWPVRLGLTPAGIFLVVFAPEPFSIDPEWLRRPDVPFATHRLARWNEGPATSYHGQTWPLAEPQHFAATGGARASSAAAEASFLLENDWQFHQKFTALGACGTCWILAQQALLNVAEQLFESSSLAIRFRITSQWTCPTSTACPYPSLPLGAADWLLAFRNRWESITTEPPHHLGHLLVSTDLPGNNGVAYQAGLATDWGYGLSEAAITTTNILAVHPYGTMAHEIGHGFDGLHEEADPIPPALQPTGVTGWAHTIMWSGQFLKYQFSDGSWDVTHNNRARVAAMAAERL